jgi:Zn-dependent peptidase ImmA (M78 family)
MDAHQGNARHIQQEAEANTFAIELLTPRRLLQQHLKPAAELNHALAIAERFDISREAATRRYVALHRNCLAVVFSRGQCGKRSVECCYFDLHRGLNR